MSGFSLWDADDDAQNAPQRQAKTAAAKLSAAISDVHEEYGPFLLSASGKDEFEDRWHYSKADIRKTVNEHIPPVTGIMRRVHDALKREFKATLGDDNADDPTKEPKGGKDEPTTINDRQKAKIDKGDKTVGDEVKTNTGDGSDAEGKNPSKTTGPQADPRDAGPERKKSHRTADLDGDEDDQALIPEGNFEGYLNEVDQGGPEKVQRNFGSGGDTGKDHVGARLSEGQRLAVELYQDFARANGMRIASRNTLEHYADTGLNDSDYWLLANLIHQASEDCECDDEESSDSGDSDNSTPTPPPSNTESDSSDDSSDDDSDSGSDDSGGESSDDSDSSSESDSDSDSDSDSSDSDSDAGGGDNPFAAADDAPDEAGPPADDGGSVEAPPGPPDLGPEEDAGPPVGPEDAGPPVEAPPGPPDLSEAPPLAQDDFSGVEEYAPDAASALPPDTELVPVEQIEDALGLPPGTLEQILMESAGGGGAPPPGPPQHQMAKRRKRAAEEDPSSGGGDSGDSPSAGGQAVAPAAASQPDAAVAPAAPAAPAADNGALLDQAGQAVTQLVDQKTQEYQTIIDPLQQALQAIQFAQQVEQAENPLDVTPPEGTVDVGPAAAAQPPQAAPAQAAPAAAPAAPAAPVPGQPLQQQAFRIAKAFGLSHKGYQTVLGAMSRKHYQHVAEAIQTLPPEHRMGLAASLADMFRADNVRFNTGQFLSSAGVPMGQDAVRLGGNPRDRAWDAYASGRDRGVAEHGAHDLDRANWEDNQYPEPFNAGGVDPGNQHYPEPDRNPNWDEAYIDQLDPETGQTHPGWQEWQNSLHRGSRRPFVVDTRRSTGGRPRTAGETWKNTPVTDSFEFPNSGKPEVTDNMKVNDLPKLKTPTKSEHITSGVVDDYQRFDKRRAEQGLDLGGDTEVDNFLDTHKVGPRAQTKLHQQLGLEPHTKAASFQPKVAGWDWDEHLSAYVTEQRRPFRCTTAGCDTVIPTPSYGTCRCGRVWNTYAIGEGQHLASGEAQMYLAREIPMREGVIMANRQFFAEERANEAEDNVHSDGPFQDYAEDVDFFEDEELDTAPTPHAPGETDSGGTKTAGDRREWLNEREVPGVDYDPEEDKRANDEWKKTQQDRFKDKQAASDYEYEEGNEGDPSADREYQDWVRKQKNAASYGDDDHNVTYRDGERFCSACDAMLWDPNVHHCPDKQAKRYLAEIQKLDTPNDAWKTHTDTDNAGYDQGRAGPPDTVINDNLDRKDWHRVDNKGKYQPGTFRGK